VTSSSSTGQAARFVPTTTVGPTSRIQKSDPPRQWCHGKIRKMVSRYVLLECRQTPEHKVKASAPWPMGSAK
jgi:hypothetical protein